MANPITTEQIEAAKAFSKAEHEKRNAQLNPLSFQREKEQSSFEDRQIEGKDTDPYANALAQADRELNAEAAAFNAEWRIAMLKLVGMMYNASCALEDLGIGDKYDPQHVLWSAIKAKWHDFKNKVDEDQIHFPQDINASIVQGKLEIPIMDKNGQKDVNMTSHMNNTGNAWLEACCGCEVDADGTVHDAESKQVITDAELQQWMRAGRNGEDNLGTFVDKMMKAGQAPRPSQFNRSVAPAPAADSDSAAPSAPAFGQ